MSKVIYTLIGNKYYKIDQNCEIPSEITKNIHNSVSYTEKTNLNELDLNVDLTTIDVQHTLTNKEECDKMKQYLRTCTNIREIDVIPNRFKMRLTYSIYDENNKPVDNSSTMRDVDPTDMLLALGVNEYNEALYRRIKVFNPRFKFMVRNIIPYGIMRNERKKYTIRIDDIALYQQLVREIDSPHPSMYDTPYNVTSPTINDTLGDMLLIYSTKLEGIVYNPVTVSYVPRSVYVNIKLMKDGYISFYTESEIQEILSENMNKPLKYHPCDRVITVNNRIELNGSSKPEPTEVFKYTISATDPESEKYLPDESLIHVYGYGSANFGTMTFDAPGIYTYYVYQINGDNEMYNYSDEVYKITITVKKYPDYTLDATMVIQNNAGETCESVQFVNYYGITPTDYQFLVSNILNGPLPEESEEFTFSISQMDDDNVGPLPEPNVITINGAGVGAFNPVTFDEIGVYNYKISLIKGGTENCEYDSDDVIVNVVTEKSINSILPTVIYTKNDTHYDSATFVSKYNYNPVNTLIGLTSNLTGDIPEEPIQFSYIITPVTNETPDVETSTITVPSNQTEGYFENIILTEPGLYVYKVTQNTIPGTSYTLDKSVYYIMITVTANYDNLTVKIDYAKTELSNKVDSIVFTNNYKLPDPSSALGNTTHMVTSGSSIPDDDGLIYYYTYCRDTTPFGLQIVEDDLPVEEYDDKTMIPITCVLNDLQDAVAGRYVLFNRGKFNITY